MAAISDWISASVFSGCGDCEGKEEDLGCVVDGVAFSWFSVAAAVVEAGSVLEEEGVCFEDLEDLEDLLVARIWTCWFWFVRLVPLCHSKTVPLIKKL